MFLKFNIPKTKIKNFQPIPSEQNQKIKWQRKKRKN